MSQAAVAAIDGICHNSRDGGLTECGRTAEWRAGQAMPDGSTFWMGVCSECKSLGGDVVSVSTQFEQIT